MSRTSLPVPCVPTEPATDPARQVDPVASQEPAAATALSDNRATVVEPPDAFGAHLAESAVPSVDTLKESAPPSAILRVTRPENADAVEEYSDVAWQLAESDRRFLMMAGATVLILSAVHWALLSGFGLREVEIDRLPQRALAYQIDINRATWVEWMQLENIGELTARKIVADREQRGPFRSIDDVTRVPGIGTKTLARIRPQLACGDCPPKSLPPE